MGVHGRPSKYVAGAAITVAVFTAVVGWHKWRRSHNWITAHQAREAAKSERVAQWATRPVVPILSDQIDEAIADVLRASDCMSAPAGARPVKWESLTSAEQEDLRDEIKGLLQLVARNDPSAIFNHLESRGEMLDPEMRTFFVNMLLQDPRHTKQAL